MLRCRLKCNDADGNPLKGVSHFHCFTCARIFERTESLTNHLYNHKRQNLRHSETVSDTILETRRQHEDTELYASSCSNADVLSYECETCLKHFSSKKSLRNHIKYIHVTTDYINANRFLHGVCVDPRQGLYLVRRSFSGTSHPIHVFHSFGVNGGFSCELDECREFSKTARRSGNPNFMCCHLKSVQYVLEPFKPPPAMSRTVLEELIGKVKWLKQSREQECLQAQAVAENSKAPLLVEFCNSKNITSTRYQHFSVYAGEVHHYSRFQRVVVSYDMALNKWTCGCCRTKVSCVHKSIGKWYLYQVRPGDLSCNNKAPHTLETTADTDTNVEEGELSGNEFVENQNEQEMHAVISGEYPPKGVQLTRMVEYIHSCKRIPPTLPKSITHDVDVQAFPRILAPTEEVCGHCEGAALSDPKCITRRGKIFTINKVINGKLICGLT